MILTLCTGCNYVFFIPGQQKVSRALCFVQTSHICRAPIITKVDSPITEPITKFPTTSTCTDLRSFLDWLTKDASRHGLGLILKQETPLNQWVPVQVAAKSCYAIIELEMLAVAWVANKCKMFLIGLQDFQIIPDHNP